MPKAPKTPPAADPPLSDYDRWLVSAANVQKTDNPLNIPYDVAISEAAQVAKVAKKYWKAEGERPGLSSAKKRLPEVTAEEIPSLVRAVQEAQTRLLLLVDPIVVDRGERARFLVDELESAIEFLLDDDVEEPADSQLAKIQAFHSQNGERSSALVQALRDYAALAEELKARLVEVDEEFDVALIEEARALSTSMGENPVAVKPTTPEAIAATKVRNQLLHLLTGKVRLVRRTVARVFRRHSEIVREASSAYERRRRAAARRAKKNEEPKGKPE